MGRQKKKDGRKFSKRNIVPNNADGSQVQGNQWQSTPRQQKWLIYYMDPREKETWGNAYQAAIKAGYSESHANTIATGNTALDWVKQARNIMRLNPEHLKTALNKIITSEFSKDSDKIAAIKLLGIDQGMFVQKQLVGHVNIEQAIDDLE